MSARMSVVLFGAKKWEFTDEKTGEIRSGATLYIDNLDDEDDLNKRSDPNHLGIKVMKMSAPLDVFKQLAIGGPRFPLDCELVTRLRQGEEGKAVVQVVGIVME